MGRPIRMRLKPTRRLLKRVVLAVAILILLPFLLIPLYRFVNPPASIPMLRDWVTGTGVTRQWVPLGKISPNLVRAVVMSEDARFCDHDGIDWQEVQNALEDFEDGRPRGASTLNMQLSKNLFLWSSRSYLRKAVEARWRSTWTSCCPRTASSSFISTSSNGDRASSAPRPQQSAISSGRRQSSPATRPR